MAAGLSPEREYRLMYSRLKSIQRELAQAGVPSTYRGGELFGDGFKISYRRLNASNGECALLFEIYVRKADGGVAKYDHLSFGHGLERIKAGAA